MTEARLVRLGDICRQDRKSIKPGECGELRYIGLESIEANTGLFQSGELSKTPEVPQANSFRFGPQHVLYGKLRPYLNKVGLPDFNGKCSTEIIPLVPCEPLDRRYLAYFLRSPLVVSRISEKAAGARMPRADMGFIFDLPLPLPSLAVQCKIVDLLSRADGIVRLRREAQRRAAELIPAFFSDMFGSLPRSEFRKCGDVCEFITKGTTPKSADLSSDYQVGRVPFLKVLHITDNGSIHFAKQPAYISEELHRGALARSIVRPGDVLMNIVGPPLGRIGVVPDTYPEWNVNQALAIFRARPGLHPHFLLHALRSPLVLPEILKLPVGVRQLNISLEQCRKLEIPLPSANVQEAFAKKVDQVMALQRLQHEAIAGAEAVFSALLAQYFG